MEDWNDLRLVLAITRAGSLSAAARALGVNHSTVFRRLASVEARLGVRLFERLPAGAYALTPAGERMATAAERVESETAALDLDLLGADRRLTGRLRVTCSETLAYALLTECVAGFRRNHPGITVDLVVDNRVLSLSRREADVALRVARPRQPDLHGRKLADLAWALYARPDLLPAGGRSASQAWPAAPFIGWEETVTGVNSADWLAREIPEDAFVYRTNSVVNQMIAARSGIGVALLPCFLGDAEPTLVRAVPELIREIERELWIVTHADLRRTARVGAFMEESAAFLTPRRPQLAGLIA